MALPQFTATADKTAGPVCPFCGAGTGIYFYYRDGGSTYNHPGCKVAPLGTWPNPDFKHPAQRIRERMGYDT